MGDGIDADTNHNQQSRTTEIEGQAQLGDEDGGQHANGTQVNGADDCQSGQRLVNKLGCPLPGPDAGNKTTVLSQIFSHVFGLELNCRIEKAEKYNQDNKADIIIHGARRHGSGSTLYPVDLNKAADGGGKHHDR